MSDKEMLARTKKSKNFKEIIIQEKEKGRTRRKLLKIITGIDAAIIYSFSFLIMFAITDVLFYLLFTPSVLLWAAFLVGASIVYSIVAHYITNTIKKRQWRYARS